MADAAGTAGRSFTGRPVPNPQPPSAPAGTRRQLNHGAAHDQGPLPIGGLKPTVPPSGRIDGEEVSFGGNYDQPGYRERLAGPVKYLLAIEPGMRLMHVIDQRAELLARLACCFSFMCAASRPFAASSPLSTSAAASRVHDADQQRVVPAG
jgi:hypothetical protein